MIFDDHLTHFSINVIELAIKNNFILMKLPPHVTDIMQPLDIAMYGALKQKWDKVLNDHMGLTGPKNSIRPSDFMNMVSEMWHDAMPPKNSVRGFACTGIYPVDRSKFPLERLDVRLVNKHDEWVKAGKPVDISDDVTEADTAIIQLPELPDHPPPREEIEFNIQETTTSKQDQITSIPAPSLHIDIPDSASSTSWLQVATSSMLSTS